MMWEEVGAGGILDQVFTILKIGGSHLLPGPLWGRRVLLAAAAARNMAPEGRHAAAYQWALHRLFEEDGSEDGLRGNSTGEQHRGTVWCRAFLLQMHPWSAPSRTLIWTP